MQKIDPAFLFEMGEQLRRVPSINWDSRPADAYFVLNEARAAVEQVSMASVYSHLLRNPCQAAAHILMRQMKEMSDGILSLEDLENAKLPLVQVLKLQNLYSKFETLFIGDLQAGSLYLVQPKGGYDTDKLTEVQALIDFLEVIHAGSRSKARG